MKNYKIIVTATTTKELAIRADSLQEAFDLGFDIVSEGSILTFGKDDIVTLAGEVSEDEFEPEIECQECPYYCTSCGNCTVSEFED